MPPTILVCVYGLGLLHPGNVYVSPPLGWLNDQRIYWNLGHSPFTIKAQSGDKSYGRRYMEFALIDSSRKGDPVEFDGQFNCWSRNRLKVLDLVDSQQIRQLAHGKTVMVKEKENISCLIASSQPGYYLYLQIGRPSSMPARTVIALRHLLGGVSLRDTKIVHKRRK